MSVGLERAGAVTRARSPWLAFGLLMALSGTLVFFEFGALIFTTNDEARFPMMARDILTRGHWLTPEINGVPMLNKPPLHAWLIAVSAWPTGAVTQRTAAVPSVLAALGLVAATYWIGRRLFDASVGFTAGLLAVTTAGVFSLARSPVPDMTLSLALIGAMAAFVKAELDGRRGALVAFYGLVAVAFWIKGPPGMLPIVVALGYEIVTFGWRSGPVRLVSWAGLTILVLLVAPWWLLALRAGQAEFVNDVVMNDYVRTYFIEGSWGPERFLAPLGQAFTSLLPWSLVLPVALWWVARGVAPAQARGARLAVVWATVVFIAVAVSQRQRWRYYLPLSPPVALLLAAGFHQLRWRWRGAAFASVWITSAAGLMVGQAAITARQSRMTDWQAIGQEVEKRPEPLFALDAPDIVFGFYLNRPVLGTPDYQTFARAPAPRYLLAPARAVARLSGEGQVREVAEGLVGGRHFVLLKRE
jgi:4-amino-4-deoxy-L-arabinose transferase-like glycosyltransferase